MFALFGGGKKKTSDNGTIQFLNKADEAYVRAFQTKVLGNLDRYLTRVCCTKLMERIRMSSAECVGMERYKKVEWKKNPDGTYTKVVTFEDINMGCGIKVPLGDPYVEHWTLTSENDDNKVSDIRRQSC